MTTVDIEVNGRAYRLTCEDGQENRLRQLAAYVDGRLKALTGGGRAGTDAQMLVMTCLVLADELHDVIEGREFLAGRGLVAAAAAAPPSPHGTDEAAMVAAVDDLTRRIEAVAHRLAGA